MSKMAGLPSYTLPLSNVRALMSASGGVYQIAVAWPEGPAPAAGYPVLFVLDGEDHFPVAAEISRRVAKFPDAMRADAGIVVGVGYAPDESRRSIDYTPKTPPVALAPGDRNEPVGGADAFLDFIVDELLPLICGEHPVDPSRLALFGHSYGGLFTLHALFTRPGIFSTYIASSPSIWFGERFILQEAAEYLARGDREGPPKTLVLTVGEHEQGSPDEPADRAVSPDRAERLARRRMVDNARDLAAELKAGAADRLTTHFRVLSGENHGTASLPALGGAVQHAFARRV